MGRVLTEEAGGLLTVTLADEANRNALSEAFVDELTAVLDRAEADPDIRVIVVTNRGPAFCAGASLGKSSPSGAKAMNASELFRRFRRSAKPYIGRIAGHCVGGGVGLAAAMDIAVAVDSAMFGFSEVRIGVAPAIISVVCLPKMREADARAAFLRGNRFSAAEAARIGLITSAVPTGDLDAAVDAAVADLLAGGPEALAATKQLLDRVPALPIEAAFEWTTDLSTRLFASDEAKAGIASFLEKRPAPWVPAP
jgi:methylglutaconyl-CoA hydratase